MYNIIITDINAVGQKGGRVGKTDYCLAVMHSCYERVITRSNRAPPIALPPNPFPSPTSSSPTHEHQEDERKRRPSEDNRKKDRADTRIKREL